jgi:hypothetical protein
MHGKTPFSLKDPAGQGTLGSDNQVNVMCVLLQEEEEMAPGAAVV